MCPTNRDIKTHLNPSRQIVDSSETACLTEEAHKPDGESCRSALFKAKHAKDVCKLFYYVKSNIAN